MDDKPPLKGRGQSHMTHFQFFYACNHISIGTAEERVAKYFYACKIYTTP